jgi:hypothetical protein
VHYIIDKGPTTLASDHRGSCLRGDSQDADLVATGPNPKNAKASRHHRQQVLGRSDGVPPLVHTVYKPQLQRFPSCTKIAEEPMFHAG